MSESLKTLPPSIELTLAEATKLSDAKQYDQAYSFLLQAITADPAMTSHVPKSMIFCCLANLDRLPAEHPATDQHLSEYIEAPSTDKGLIESITTRYFTRRYGLEQGLNDDTVLDMLQIAQDKTLHLAMINLRLSGPALALMFGEIRQELLLQAATGDLVAEWLNLIRAYGLRAIHCEFVALPSEAEDLLLQEWLQFLDIPQNPTAKHLQQAVYDLLILSMYMPLNKILRDRDLSAVPLDCWPTELISHASKTLFEPLASA